MHAFVISCIVTMIVHSFTKQLMLIMTISTSVRTIVILAGSMECK